MEYFPPPPTGWDTGDWFGNLLDDRRTWGTPSVSKVKHFKKSPYPRVKTSTGLRGGGSYLMTKKKKKKAKEGYVWKNQPSDKQLFKYMKYEKSYIDTLQETTLDGNLFADAFFPFYITELANGTTNSKRIKNMVLLWSLQYRIQVFQPIDYITPRKPGPCEVRIFYLLDKKPTGSLPSLSDVFACPTTSVGSATLYGPQGFILADEKRWKILCQETIELDGTQGQLVSREGYLKLNFPLYYSGTNTFGTLATVKKNAIYMCLYCHSKTTDVGTGQSFPYYKISQRVTYYDT